MNIEVSSQIGLYKVLETGTLQVFKSSPLIFTVKWESIDFTIFIVFKTDDKDERQYIDQKVEGNVVNIILYNATYRSGTLGDPQVLVRKDNNELSFLFSITTLYFLETKEKKDDNFFFHYSFLEKVKPQQNGSK